jgi:hypothetical protein
MYWHTFVQFTFSFLSNAIETATIPLDVTPNTLASFLYSSADEKYSRWCYGAWIKHLSSFVFWDPYMLSVQRFSVEIETSGPYHVTLRGYFLVPWLCWRTNAVSSIQLLIRQQFCTTWCCQERFGVRERKETAGLFWKLKWRSLQFVLFKECYIIRKIKRAQIAQSV